MKRKLPKYSVNQRKGNIGEAFVKCILSSFCLVHKIDSSQDLGNDFICELTKEEYPANILFYVQVKYWQKQPTDKNRDIEKVTEYWKDSPIPTYLFWIDVKDNLSFDVLRDLEPKMKIDCLKYKRYTPISHGNTEEKIKTFKPFSKTDFLRDIMVDYSRCLYKKGMSTVIKKNDFTEVDKANIPLGDFCLFVEDVIPKEYKNEFIKNSWTNLLATAKSLFEYEPDNEKLLILALEHAQLANKMIDLADPIFFEFKTTIKKIEGEIRSHLEGK